MLVRMEFTVVDKEPIIVDWERVKAEADLAIDRFYRKYPRPIIERIMYGWSESMMDLRPLQTSKFSFVDSVLDATVDGVSYRFVRKKVELAGNPEPVLVVTYTIEQENGEEK